MRPASGLFAVCALLAGCLVPGAALAAPTAGPGQWYISDYGIDRAWKTSTGKGVKVAVIDSGIKDSHEDLHDTVVAAKDFSGSGKDGRTPVGPEETIKHGTAVAGVIAGQGVGEGPRGVAPDAELLSASMWLGSGAPDGSSDSRTQAAQAVRWAVDKGARVINMSLGWDDPAWPESWDEAFGYAYSKDVLVVACVGNRSQGARRAWSPATVPGVIGVGGLGRDGRVDQASSAPGTSVDLMGPAQAIPVPFYQGGYAEAEGCSFAAPVVAGVAALIRSAHPDYSADQVSDVLLHSAAPVKGHKGRGTAAQPDPTVGFGRLDPLAALAASPAEHPRSAAEELAAWKTMHRRADTAPQNTAGASAPATTAAATDTPAQAQQGRPRAVLGPVVLASGIIAALVCACLGLIRVRRGSGAGAGQSARMAAEQGGIGAESPCGRPGDGPADSRTSEEL